MCIRDRFQVVPIIPEIMLAYSPHPYSAVLGVLHHNTPSTAEIGGSGHDTPSTAEIGGSGHETIAMVQREQAIVSSSIGSLLCLFTVTVTMED